MSHALADVVHVYLSTGCLHGEHGYCSAPVGLVGDKKPAQCKFCAAPCRCQCHGGVTATRDPASATLALLAADAVEGDPYPALIPEYRIGLDQPALQPVGQCDACGRTVRGALLPLWRPDQPVLMVGRGCFRKFRANASHLDDPLPMPQEGTAS